MNVAKKLHAKGVSLKLFVNTLNLNTVKMVMNEQSILASYVDG